MARGNVRRRQVALRRHREKAPRDRFFSISHHRKRGVAKARRHGWQMHLRELIWPTMGIKAWLRWLGLNLVRQAENPHTVALGFAIGVWVSFVPILGTHLLLSVVLCSIVGGSYLAAMAGTFLCNPWTIGFMWFSAYEVGRRVLQLPRTNIRAMLEGHLTLGMLWEHAAELIHKVFYPMIVGANLLGIPAALAMYVLVYWQVKVWRRRRLLRIQAKLLAAAEAARVAQVQAARPKKKRHK